MDGRPHLLSILDYQDLWTQARNFRFRSSPCDVCGRGVGGKEREVDNRAYCECGCGEGSRGNVRVAVRFDGATRLLKRFDEERTAFEDEGFEQGLRCGEAEAAGAQEATSEVNSQKVIRSKETPDSLEQSRGREENSQHEAPALESDPNETGEDGTGIRKQGSNFHATCRAKQGRDSIEFDASQILREGNGDIACGYSVHMLQPPAEGGSELARKIAAVLGPAGPGILAVRNVPGVAELRKRLLPMAKRLALMPDQLRRLVLKEHGLNADVPLKRPDRRVSAFATQLRYGCHYHLRNEPCNKSPDGLDNIMGRQKVSTDNAGLPTRTDGDRDEEDLGRILRHLGSLMVEVGLLIARLCDEVCPGAELEDAILESGIAKGRLIHYHSQPESNVMSSKKRNGSSKKALGIVRNGVEGLNNDVKRRDCKGPASIIPGDPQMENDKLEPWQEWHFDYGLFTVLTSPLYMKWESSVPGGGRDSLTSCTETSSWIHAGGDHSGLIIVYQGVAQYVNIPPNCLLVQVGEAAQILSGGNLAATPHCVCRPPGADLSRETFVVFLQPAWHRSLRPPSEFDIEKVLHPRYESAFRDEDSRKSLADCRCERSLHPESANVDLTAPGDPDERERSEELWNMQRTLLLHALPPLASRWSEGCTFAEFSTLTTRQYYGAGGHQSQK